MTFQTIWNDLHAQYGYGAVVGQGVWTEESYNNSGIHAARVVEEHLGGFEGKRVLEYGCGDGRIAQHVVAKCQSLACADASSLILDKCRLKVPLATHHLAEWPYEVPGEFDAIYAVAVAYHLTDVEVFRFMSEMKNKLAPGGRLAFDFCNVFHPSYQNLLRLKASSGDWKVPWPWVPMDGATLAHVAGVLGYTEVKVCAPDNPQPWMELTR